MVQSKLGDRNNKGSCQRKQPFRKIEGYAHPVVKALGRFLLTGWQTKIY